jgi:hypothetical protein
MAKTFTAPFAQAGKTAHAIVTGASDDLTTTAPSNTEFLCKAGLEGALLTRLSSVPRATVTATSLLLCASKDDGATKYLLDSALMAPHTVQATTAIPLTTFSRYTEDTPLRMEANLSLYVGAAVALAGGIAFNGNYTDF